MKLYKLVNGYPSSAPKEFIENGKRIVGFTDDFLLQRGYKPLVESEPTSEEQLDYYEETDTQIKQIWK